MDPGIERMLDKVFQLMPNWKLLHLDEGRVTDEVYDVYHGAEIAAPPPTTTQDAYDGVVDQLRSAVEQKHGLYQKESHDHVFTNPTPASSDGKTEWRVYVNIKAANLAAVGLFIVNTIFPKGLADGFKVARDVDDADHFRDPLVIYCDSEQNCGAIVQLLQTDAGIIGGLNPHPPMMTRILAPGIGIGESPKDFKISFGKIRAAAIAKAVVSFWASEHPGSSVAEDRAFLSWLVEQTFRLIGVDPNQGYRNCGSQATTIDLNKFKAMSLLDVIKKRDLRRSA